MNADEPVDDSAPLLHANISTHVNSPFRRTTGQRYHGGIELRSARDALTVGVRRDGYI